MHLLYTLDSLQPWGSLLFWNKCVEREGVRSKKSVLALCYPISLCFDVLISKMGVINFISQDFDKDCMR